MRRRSGLMGLEGVKRRRGPQGWNVLLNNERSNEYANNLVCANESVNMLELLLTSRNPMMDAVIGALFVHYTNTLYIHVSLSLACSFSLSHSLPMHMHMRDPSFTSAFRNIVCMLFIVVYRCKWCAMFINVPGARSPTPANNDRTTRDQVTFCLLLLLFTVRVRKTQQTERLIDRLIELWNKLHVAQVFPFFFSPPFFSHNTPNFAHMPHRQFNHNNQNPYTSIGFPLFQPPDLLHWSFFLSSKYYIFHFFF